jgi:hypothetical protein
MIINFFDEAKSYTALLLNQFSSLELRINETDTYNIPIVFGTPDRLRSKLTKSNKYRKPVMCLTLLSDAVDLERNTNRLLKRKKLVINENQLQVTYNDQPTIFSFELWIMSDTLTSLTNIVSAISTTFYNNYLYIDYKTPLDETIRTPIKLESTEYLLDNNESEFTDNRTIEAKFQIDVHGVKHSQVSSTNGYINEINLYLDSWFKDVQKNLDTYTINP